jgi:hypothetical protein
MSLESLCDQLAAAHCLVCSQKGHQVLLKTASGFLDPLPDFRVAFEVSEPLAVDVPVA